MNPITKQLLPVMAIILVAFMITPSLYASTLDESEILVDMESANADEYDELNNLAVDPTASNYETWDPMPNGIWIGSTTEESLYKLNIVTANNSFFTMTWAVRFEASQIMSGASKFTVRLPVHVDSLVMGVSLSILASDTVDSHDLVANAPDWNDGAEISYIYTKDYFNPADASVMDGNDVFVRSNRMYASITAPLLPNQIYVFVMGVAYAAEANPSFYISPNDVANDQIINSWMGWSIPTGPGVFSVGQERFDIDWGHSYDMVGGLGNGITSLDLYMNPGDQLWFTVWAPYALGINGHHTIGIPFYTANGSAQFNVTVSQRYPGGPTVLSNTSMIWYDQMILASHDSPVNVTGSTSFHKQFTVNITSCIGQWVTFYFKNNPTDGPGVTLNGTKYSMINPDPSNPYANDAELFIGFTPIYSYLVCPAKIATPVMGSVVEPVGPETESVFGSDIIEGLFMFGCGLFIGAVWTIVKTFDVQTVGEAIVYVATMAHPAGWAWWVVSAFSDLPTPVDVYREIRGEFFNLIDTIWDALKALGNFLRSIGEYLFDSLTWLAEQIVEYGAILLSILCLIAVCIICYFAIWGQIKLWSMGYKLAKGDLEGAASEGTSTINTVSRLAGRKPPGGEQQ